MGIGGDTAKSGTQRSAHQALAVPPRMFRDPWPLIVSSRIASLLSAYQRPVGDENLMIEKIDLGTLEHVVAKFLPRIVDAVMDQVGSVQQDCYVASLCLLNVCRP